MSFYIMAIDQGTTSSRACLIDPAGSLVAQHSIPFEQHFPQPGWVEHDAEQIWQSVTESIQGVLQKSKISASQIRCIGITNQRETVVPWDADSGKALYKAIVWQCRRTTAFCESLKKKKLEKKIQSTTGLLIDPYFSGSKIRWLLQNSPEVQKALQQKKLKVGTIDSFLLFRLSGGGSHATDVSNASRTMLMNLKTLAWDSSLLKIFSVPEFILPKIQASNSLFGQTKGLGFLPDGIPITGILGDQQAALFGQAAFEVGEAKCTFGTGSFILLNTGEKISKSKARLLSTVAWQLENKKANYAIEGGAFVCGAAVQWLRDGLGLIQSSAEVEALANQVSDSAGVEFVPALTGMGAPYWRAEARGLICGLTRGSTKAHIARATLEAMALQNVEILIAMKKDLQKNMKSLKVDGGAIENSLLMQLQSDYLGMQVICPEQKETTVMGAAYMAGLGRGVWKNLSEIKKIWKSKKVYQTKLSTSQRVKRLAAWKKAIERTIHE